MLGEIRGEVRFKEPLSFHTSLRIGGIAWTDVVWYIHGGRNGTALNSKL